jgi:hypothetical protein
MSFENRILKFHVLFLTIYLSSKKTSKIEINFTARDKIYTGVRREPDGGKLSSAVGGPDVCR